MNDPASRSPEPFQEPEGGSNRVFSALAWVVLALVFAAACYALTHPRILERFVFR
jgi:hypothetical protein